MAASQQYEGDAAHGKAARHRAQVERGTGASGCAGKIP